MRIQLKCLDINLEESSWDNFEWRRTRFSRPFLLLPMSCHENYSKEVFYRSTKLLADPRGRNAPPIQFLSFSYNFRQKPCQIIGFCSKIRCWRPLSVWEILDPPLERDRQVYAEKSNFWKQHRKLSTTITISRNVVFFLPNSRSNLKRTVCVLNEVVTVFTSFLCRTKNP